MIADLSRRRQVDVPLPQQGDLLEPLRLGAVRVELHFRADVMQDHRRPPPQLVVAPLQGVEQGGDHGRAAADQFGHRRARPGVVPEQLDRAMDLLQFDDLLDRRR